MTNNQPKPIKMIKVKATKSEKRLCRMVLLESLHQVMKGDIYK